MNCPVCNVELKPADREGIEIDYCPKCRGVWVAREELDRILAQPTPFDVDWLQRDTHGNERYEPAHGSATLRRTGKTRSNREQAFWTDLFRCR